MSPRSPRVTRRAVLGQAAVLPALALPWRAAGQAGGTAVSLLLDGIGPGLAPGALQRTVAPFLAAGLPVTCVADLAALTAPDAGGGALCDALARLMLDEPGLVDLALPIGKLDRPERYFQLRRAGALREAVARAFATGPAAKRPFPVVTLIDRGEDANIDHTAFRGAGFRLHLRAGDGPTVLTVAGRGEMVLSGGLWTALDAPDLGSRLEAALGLVPDLVLALAIDSPGAEAAAGGVAALLARAEAAGRVQLASPVQRRLYAAPALRLDIALVVDPGTGPDEAEAALAFVRDLATQGVPLTMIGTEDRFPDLPGTVRFCPATDLSPLAECQLDREGPDASAPVRVHLAADPSFWPRQGIDADGRLLLTFRQLADEDPGAVLQGSSLEDHVIRVRPDAVRQPARRTELVRRLVEAGLSGQAYFHTVPGLADHLVTTEPVLARLWSVRRRRQTDPWLPPAPTPDKRARLLDDARLAWRYIERFTDADSGLCAGTVQTGAVTVINREATLWDMASQLHGIRVAERLALVSRDAARDRVRQLIRSLPLAEVDGLALPPAMFRTDDGTTVTPGFDICDAGRFLIALRAVVTAGLLDRLEADLVLAQWDLAGAIRDGRPHSHVGGRWIDTTLSHCTPYIRRGLAPWGIALASPYTPMPQGSLADRQIAQLYDVARIGQVGVEPVLLDRIELGPDPEADLIAEVLYDAQLDWYETTGRLKCPSEAPLNFAPWFSYQGLRVGALGDAAWVVRGLGGAAEHDTPAFRARAELLSTKSAFLWSAVREHGWSDLLLHVVRQKTRIEGFGFSVGVFAATLEAMPGYTDLNTNGVILTAIGHVLD